MDFPPLPLKHEVKKDKATQKRSPFNPAIRPLITQVIITIKKISFGFIRWRAYLISITPRSMAETMAAQIN